MRRKCAKTVLCFSVAAAVLLVVQGLLGQRQRPTDRNGGGDDPPAALAQLSPTITPSTDPDLSYGLKVSLQKQRRHVSFPEPDTLPYRKWRKSTEDRDTTQTWAVALRDYLSMLDKDISPHVNLVLGDYKHRMLVLNWVVAAAVKLEPPLHNILVISLQQGLCDFLANSTYISHLSNITCIVVPVDTIFSSKSNDDGWLKSLMVRPVVLRLINYWGYDVATYDSDAVVLKNPQELYKRHPHDILSSANIWPEYQAKPWGFTLCAGVMVLRASSATGIYYTHPLSLV